MSVKAVKKAVKPAAKKAAKKKAANKPESAGDVGAYMKALDHPLKKDIEAARKAILAADPKIEEGIKWNAPSYRLEDYFATFHLRAPDKVQLVFHRGATAKTDGRKMKIADPNGLAKWLSDDRCLVTLGAGNTAKANLPALKSIVVEWIAQL